MITTTQRHRAKNDPRIARELVKVATCDYCTEKALTFIIDGVTTDFVCREHYLIRAKERSAETAAMRRAISFN